jgi:hypothetical protein
MSKNFQPTPEALYAVLNYLVEKGRAKMALNAIAGGGSGTVATKQAIELIDLNNLEAFKGNQMKQYGNNNHDNYMLYNKDFAKTTTVVLICHLSETVKTLSKRIITVCHENEAKSRIGKAIESNSSDNLAVWSCSGSRCTTTIFHQ